jgi:hypothetical protein
MFTLSQFYIAFYFFTRFSYAHSPKDDDDKMETIRWFVMAPFAPEMFVGSWILLDLYNNVTGREDGK